MSGEIAAIPDLSSWPEAGRLAPRDETVEGQHAGVLTTPQLLYFRDNPRDRLQMFYEKLWCSGPPHNGKVTAEVVLGLGTGNVRVGNGDDRAASWKQLATRPVCTECHARMDYGAQFFAGYREVRVAPFFVSSEVVSGTGPLFHHNIDDPRGEGRLTPRGFADLALAQPEFGRCMVQEVAQYVFADRYEPADLLALRASFERDGTLRGMMRVALRRYYARLTSKPSVAVDAPGPKASEKLQALVEQHCYECHEEGPHDFSKGEWTRATLIKMLTRVSFGTMPKNDRLSSGARERFIDELLVAAFPAGAVRQNASIYFQSQLRALPTHTLPAILRVIRGGADEGRLGPSRYLLAVPPDVMQLSPGIAAIMATEAASACADQPEALEECLKKRLAWRDVVYARTGQ